MSAQPTVTISFTPQAQAVLARFEKLPQNILIGIKRGMDEANQITVGVIQKEFLSYPKGGPSTLEGLRVQTNRLRSSIRASKAVISGDAVQSSIGSNVKYAALHEFGGTVHHKARNGVVRLRTDRKGNLLRQGADGKLAIFAKRTHKTAKEVSYEGKAYDVTYPARAFVRRGIIRNMEYTRECVSRWILAAANGKANGGAN